MSMKRKRILDGKTCWKAWVKPGSSLLKACREVGVVNPRTGRPPTPRAFEVSAYRWVLDGTPADVQEARRDYAYYKLSMDGETVGDREWGIHMVEMIKTTFHKSEKALAKYVNRHGLQQYVSQVS